MPDAQGDIGINPLTFKVVGIADNRSLGNGGMGNKRAFDFGGAKAVARDVDDIINAACDPIIAIFIAAATIPGKIQAGKG